MVNQKHLDILEQGVAKWNQWREEQVVIQPSFFGANLSDADLSDANLSNTFLNNVNFSGANLKGINLKGANLKGANFSDAYLSGANLVDTILVSADLSGADLSGANLRNADLTRAYLNRVYLRDAELLDANFTEAIVARVVFGDVDLHAVKGLKTVKHQGPSTIGIDTIYRSHGDIPEVFLKDAGIDDTFLTSIRSLVGKANEYYSCFISYSSKDDAFAKQLHFDLQSQKVRCWFAPEDMKIGDEIRMRIDESIRAYDKLLLVLSEHSVESTWVEDEVEAALEKERFARERGESRTVLFPIQLDESINNFTSGWPAKIRRTRHIGDFTCWKDHDEYQKAFKRLLHDLQTIP